MQQADFMAWWIETFRRFALKTPRFFQIYQTIGAVAFLVSFAPLILGAFRIDLPERVDDIVGYGVRTAGAIMWLMSKMPTVNPNEPVNAKGEKVPVQEALPFTSALPPKQK